MIEYDETNARRRMNVTMNVFKEDNDAMTLRNHPDLLKILLKDQTTGLNIIWATSNTELSSVSFDPTEKLIEKPIELYEAQYIKPRIEKLLEEQKIRTKGRAEVFTPTWIIKKMVDTVESDLQGLSLTRYIEKLWLEITCGEAPFIVSRYDAVTGYSIPVMERVGFLDKKLQRITREVDDQKQWLMFAKKAYKTTYGYEFQGDSLLIARENLLYSFIDYHVYKFGEEPEMKDLKEFARIISFNIFQMDGLEYTIPLSGVAKEEQEENLELFLLFEIEEEVEQLEKPKKGIPVLIKNWSANQNIEFQTIKQEGMLMKFDVVIGNPPYQEEAQGDNTAGLPIYHKFIEEVYKISPVVELITPARFLFNAGQTPKAWNEKMLQDPHFKVVYYEQDSSGIFPNTDIKGGVSISYRDVNKEFGAIGTFTSYPELQSIMKKVSFRKNYDSIGEIIYSQTKFNLESLYNEHPEYKEIIGSNGNDKRFRNNIFDKISIFTEIEKNKDDIKILGLVNKKRSYRYIPKRFVELDNDNLDRYKVLIPAANGSGIIGEVLSTPLIGTPQIGFTQTFMALGSFENIEEAEHLLKYVKSKFLRIMLGTMKITQHNLAKEVWKNVPLQDFTSSSDIDWSKTIPEIDQQLYAKYGLSEEEIDFIETKVKEME